MNPPTPLKLVEWYTQERAAKTIGVSARTVRRMGDDGTLRRAWRPIKGRRPEAVYHPDDVEKEAAKILRPNPVEDDIRPAWPEPTQAIATRPGIPEVLERFGELMKRGKQAPPLWLTLEAASEYSGLSQALITASSSPATYPRSETPPSRSAAPTWTNSTWRPFRRPLRSSGSAAARSICLPRKKTCSSRDRKKRKTRDPIEATFSAYPVCISALASSTSAAAASAASRPSHSWASGTDTRPGSAGASAGAPPFSAGASSAAARRPAADAFAATRR
jgi:hypothetical protein